jgi:hypothetical protein
MARHLTFVAASSLLLLTGLLLAGCEDSTVAESTLPAPSFNPQPLAMQSTAPLPQPRPASAVYAAPTPQAQPPRQQVAVRAVPQPRQQRSSGFIVPADWIPPKNVQVRPWQWIIIHHTATTFGNAAIVTRWHIDRGFDEMGYDFLIGNGTNSGDGQVEVGTRWPKQKWGAHTQSADNRFNLYGIGICLVGNFDIDHPSAAQMRSLDRLVAYLMKTYKIAPDHVLGHSDCKSTDCPGKNLNVAIVRNAAVRLLADAGDVVPQDSLAVSGELIHDVGR